MCRIFLLFLLLFISIYPFSLLHGKYASTTLTSVSAAQYNNIRDHQFWPVQNCSNELVGNERPFPAPLIYFSIQQPNIKIAKLDENFDFDPFGGVETKWRENLSTNFTSHSHADNNNIAKTSIFTHSRVLKQIGGKCINYYKYPFTCTTTIVDRTSILRAMTEFFHWTSTHVNVLPLPNSWPFGRSSIWPSSSQPQFGGKLLRASIEHLHTSMGCHS